MPPRKSDVAKASTSVSADDSAAAPAAAAAANSSTPAKEHSHREKDGVNIEDLGLPKSIVTRLAKSGLPAGTQIQGTAVVGLGKSATVWVAYVASQANEYAQEAGRKTVGPQDVLRAIEEVGFGEWRGRLEGELERFGEVRKGRKKKGKEKEGEGEEGRPKKKARVEVGGGHEAVGEETEVGREENEEGDEEQEVEEGEDDEVEEEEGEEDGQDDKHEDDEEEEENEDESVEERDHDEDEALDNGEDSD